MRDAGERDKLVSVERAIAEQDGYGEEIAVWTAIGREWAAVYFGRGEERRQAAVEQGSQAATFNMLANNLTRSIGLKDRLIWGGEAWDVTGIAPIGRAEIDFTAVRAN